LNIPYVHSYERIRKNEKSQLEITSNARKVWTVSQAWVLW
jgi:hypothetical protein